RARGLPVDVFVPRNPEENRKACIRDWITAAIVAASCLAGNGNRRTPAQGSLRRYRMSVIFLPSQPGLPPVAPSGMVVLFGLHVRDPIERATKFRPVEKSGARFDKLAARHAIREKNR